MPPRLCRQHVPTGFDLRNAGFARLCVAAMTSRLGGKLDPGSCLGDHPNQHLTDPRQVDIHSRSGGEDAGGTLSVPTGPGPKLDPAGPQTGQAELPASIRVSGDLETPFLPGQADQSQDPRPPRSLSSSRRWPWRWERRPRRGPYR